MEQQVEKKKKKIDLLGFQRGLNNQFLEIFENKQSGLNFDTEGDAVADLGLEALASGFQFFLPLKDLKTISMDNAYEDIVFTKSWVLGFNQLHGEIFTITDLQKIIELIVEKKSTNERIRLTPDSRIIYLKNMEDKVAFCLNQLKLDYTAEFTSIFRCNDKDNKLMWNLSEGIEFESFVKKDKMSDAEWLLMNQINGSIALGDPIENLTEKLMAINEVQLLYFIKDVYLDSNGARPIFVLNSNSLTKFLANVSPY